MNLQSDSKEESPPKRLHYLLTSSGTNPKEYNYILGEKSVKDKFSYMALIKLLNNKDRIDKAIILVTEEAKKELQINKEDLPNVEVKTIDVPIGTETDEVKKILSDIANNIPQNCDLTIDITNGPRHFPFLLFTSSLYVQTFKDVKIKNIFYSFIKGETSKFVDLNPLLIMVNLFYAVSMFRESKNSSELYNILSNNIIKNNKIKNLIEKMNEFDIAFNSGLTLSIGDYAKSFVTQFNEIDSSSNDELFKYISIPLIKELMEYVSNSIEPYKIEETINTHSEKWIKDYPLSSYELDRQKKIIDSYIESKHYNNAIQFIREWVISRCIFSYPQEDWGKNWLSLDKRKKIENLLGSLTWRLQKNNLSGEKKELAEIWDKITKIRNTVAHNEMNVNNDPFEPDKIKKLWEDIKNKDNVRGNDFWDPSIQGGSKKLLVTSLGLSNGLLYSAIKLLQPDICIIITSKEAKRSLDEILKKSEYVKPYKVIELKDPFTGYDEIQNIIKEIKELKNSNEIFQSFEESDEIIFNLTGGTTTMQILVDMLYNIATKKLSKKTERVVIIDKREMAKQREDPYVIGEMIKYNDFIRDD